MDLLIDLVATFEGLSLKPYLCPAGIPTIGYGSTFYEIGNPVSMKDPPITKERALEILAKNLTSFQNKVFHLTPFGLTDNQYQALTSFAYNVGLDAFSRSTLLRKVNANCNDPSIRDEFMRWNKVNGTVVRGLVNRRIKEANLYFSQPTSA